MEFRSTSPTFLADRDDKDIKTFAKPCHPPPHHKHSHFVKCMMPNCKHIIYKTKAAQCSNAVKHMSQSVLEMVNLHSDWTNSRNCKLSKTMRSRGVSYWHTNHSTDVQDKAFLYDWIWLVVDHDIPVSKWTNPPCHFCNRFITIRMKNPISQTKQLQLLVLSCLPKQF
jgi:hypothetical protein